MKTTKQLIAAPKGAIFVWCNNNVDYAFHLAEYLNRQDIIIKSPMWLENQENFRGIILKPVILDHAVKLTHNQKQGYDLALTRLRL